MLARFGSQAFLSWLFLCLNVLAGFLFTHQLVAENEAAC
jgi:hypothetical protein